VPGTAGISSVSFDPSTRAIDVAMGSGDYAFAVVGQDPVEVCVTASENTAASFQCPAGMVIGGFSFASFGMPDGGCSVPSVNADCHAGASLAVLESACAGKSSCTVEASNTVFGIDPCYLHAKQLTAVAQCVGSF
jgi:hypothetical protein